MHRLTTLSHGGKTAMHRLTALSHDGKTAIHRLTELSHDGKTAMHRLTELSHGGKVCVTRGCLVRQRSRWSYKRLFLLSPDIPSLKAANGIDPLLRDVLRGSLLEIVVDHYRVADTLYLLCVEANQSLQQVYAFVPQFGDGSLYRHIFMRKHLAEEIYIDMYHHHRRLFHHPVRKQCREVSRLAQVIVREVDRVIHMTQRIEVAKP